MTTHIATAPQRRRMTMEEYLRFEFDAEYKHEYANGEVIDMSGSVGEYSLIAMNLGRELGNALKGKPYRVYDGNLRVRIHNKEFYDYPDLQVICREFEHEPNESLPHLRMMTVVDPDGNQFRFFYAHKRPTRSVAVFDA